MKLPADLTILLVEDNHINQRLAVLTLNVLALKCDVASNGREAFEMYQQKKYDLILMDMQMPVMNGVESTKIIRAFEKESGSSHRAFIVALTGSEPSEMKDICIEAGMDDFIEKPIRTEWLRSMIA